jgi:hypothetical protein
MTNNNEQKSAKQTPTELPTIAELHNLYVSHGEAQDKAYDDREDTKNKRQAAKLSKQIAMHGGEMEKLAQAIMAAVPSSLAALAIQVKVLAARSNNPQGHVVAAYAERFAGMDHLPVPVRDLLFTDADMFSHDVEQAAECLHDLGLLAEGQHIDCGSIIFVATGLRGLIERFNAKVAQAQVAGRPAPVELLPARKVRIITDRRLPQAIDLLLAVDPEVGNLVSSFLDSCLKDPRSFREGGAS